MITIGIDATNLGSGGARTHLSEVLNALRPEEHGVARVVVWGAEKTLAPINDRPWLVKRSPEALNGGLLQRSLWQRFSISKAAVSEECAVLFVPGGSHVGRFHPVVTMSRNLLPFEWRELKRYVFTLRMFKLLLLRRVQRTSFRRSDGVIFLTEYAKDAVQAVTGKLTCEVAVVPHGLATRFKKAPRVQQPISSYAQESPLKIIYASTVSEYKHQWRVVEAVGWLRETMGWPIHLELVGGATPRPRDRLYRAIARWDQNRAWVWYHGVVGYGQLHILYHSAHLGIFASSCENMPNILIETMAAGLPIACSNRGPMPEILGDAGVYFDPENSGDISDALHRLISNSDLRTEVAERSYSKVQRYRWTRCANSTFRFLADIADRSN